MLTLRHALAKAAMFLAAGLVAESLGHDRMAKLAGTGRGMPIALCALGLGGLSLMGRPPAAASAPNGSCFVRLLRRGNGPGRSSCSQADCSLQATSIASSRLLFPTLRSS
jgi:hypothetical protein